MIKIIKKGSPITEAERIYVGRGSALGNEWSHLPNTKALYRVNTRDEACDAFAAYLEKAVDQGTLQKEEKELLNRIWRAAKKGDVELECYCAPDRCHAETIKSVIEKKL